MSDGVGVPVYVFPKATDAGPRRESEADARWEGRWWLGASAKRLPARKRKFQTVRTGSRTV